MTPKEKAIEILNNLAWVCRDNGNYPEVSKQCAIITVNEIISALDVFGYTQTMYDNQETGQITFTEDVPVEKFWQSVREELNNL